MSVSGHDDRGDDARSPDETPDPPSPAAGGSSADRAAGEGPGDGNEDDVNPAETGQFEEFREDLDAVERRIAGEIDPGVRAMVVACSMFVLLLSLVLPHAGAARGFDVLLGSEVATVEHIGLPSRIFVWLALVFGIGFSLLALMTRRWVPAWIAVAGSAVAGAFGVFSIWHRQTPGINNYVGAGPGIGLVVGTLAIMVLTFHWVKVVWSRTTLQLAVEEQRRIAAAREEERQRRGRLGEE